EIDKRRLFCGQCFKEPLAGAVGKLKSGVLASAQMIKEGPDASMAETAIELVGINKSFGAVHANRDIHLEIPRGTIHGIVGENGAGKSTLMSILYGFYQADSGEIRVDGKPVTIATPNDAIATGIGMVHQHFMLVQN